MEEEKKVIPEDWNADDESAESEPVADENALEHGPRIPADVEELENGPRVPADWNKPEAEEVE
ncbi:MAG: hypothetical protein WC052_02785 [Patescibacteria group bacterium]|jgi:hypothetical protein